MTIFLNEPSLTANQSLYEAVDERLVATSITGEERTPQSTTNNSYHLLEVPSALPAHTPSCVPSRTINFTTGSPTSNAYVYINPLNGKVKHHSDDSGTTFTWSYYGKGSSDRAYDINQRRDALIEGYKLYAQGAAKVPGGTKTIVFNALNFEIGGLACILASATADCSSGGNCEFPSTTSGYYRMMYIYAIRVSETSDVGMLDATFSEEASAKASCPDPPTLERALLLAKVYVQSAGTGAGNCNYITEDNIYRITRSTGMQGDSGDGGGGVFPTYLTNCDAAVQRGDTVAWYCDTNGNPKFNSTLKKANSFVTEPGENCSGLPVVGIAGNKPDGTTGTKCYLITGGNNVYINNISGSNAVYYYQTVNDAGNITRNKPSLVGSWGQGVAYGTDNWSRFYVRIGSLWQVGYGDEPDPPNPPAPNGTVPQPPGQNCFLANVSIANPTYNYVYIAEPWVDFYPVCYSAKADSPTTCPIPYQSWNPPNDTPHSDPPKYGIYGIIIRKYKDYNSTYKTVVIQQSGLTPIDNKNQTYCDWNTDNRPIFVSPDVFGGLTKKPPIGYGQVVMEMGRDITYGAIGDNGTHFLQRLGAYSINEENYTGPGNPTIVEPPGIWVPCEGNVSVEDWVGRKATALNQTLMELAYNYRTVFGPTGADGIVTFKDPNNSSRCKILTYGPMKITKMTVNASWRYYLDSTPGNMTSQPSDPRNTDIFTQMLGYGYMPELGSNNDYNFFVNIQKRITTYESSGNQNVKYTHTLNDMSDATNPIDSEKRLCWYPGGDRVRLLNIQMFLEEDGTDDTNGKVYIQALKNNESEIFSTYPSIKPGAGDFVNSYEDASNITAGILNDTIVDNFTAGDYVVFNIIPNGTYTTSPHGLSINVHYIVRNLV